MIQLSSSTVAVRVYALPNRVNLPLPSYATSDSAGMDLDAAIWDSILLKPGEQSLIPTGLIMGLPAGYEGQIRPRSGLAAYEGVTVLNAPGTIDPGFRGEVKVCLKNLSTKNYMVQRGARIAQMVVAPYSKVQWDPDETVLDDNTERGFYGFGSTGC